MPGIIQLNDTIKDTFDLIDRINYEFHKYIH